MPRPWAVEYTSPVYTLPLDPSPLSSMSARARRTAAVLSAPAFRSGGWWALISYAHSSTDLKESCLPLPATGPGGGCSIYLLLDAATRAKELRYSQEPFRQSLRRVALGQHGSTLRSIHAAQNVAHCLTLLVIFSSVNCLKLGLTQLHHPQCPGPGQWNTPANVPQRSCTSGKKWPFGLHFAKILWCCNSKTRGVKGQLWASLRALGAAVLGRRTLA
jgi:hypothetical protein